MMSIALACTWRPRDEGRRWQALYPRLAQLYDRLAIVVPTDADAAQVPRLRTSLDIDISVAPQPARQRYAALSRAVEGGTDYIHCADGDRLLHWAETRFDELTETVSAIRRSDCLILGRSAWAFGTHPRTLRETEAIINAVGSHLLGLAVDLGGGSRGFSRAAAQGVLRNAIPESYGDAEWPVLAQRCGFAVSTRLVDGLDWETPDHFQGRAADPERQRQVAEQHEQDPARWSDRVRLALRIVQEAFAAAERPLVG
jgi:hypothetical protein